MPGPIAVYGATGYTGKLVVGELAGSDAEIVLAGRDPEKLARVAEDVGVDAPRHAAAYDNLDALRHIFGDCEAVINCAGPFSWYGEPVVRAAVETGTHYVDTTGEQSYMVRVVERFDARARAAEVAVVPAMGFDYVPGDLLCHLVAQGIEPLEELVIAYAVSRFGASRGTMKSALEMMGGGDVVYEDGDWRPAGMSPRRGHFAFAPPIGRQAVAKYPCGEIVTVPRHVDTRRIVARIATEALAPHPALAEVVPLTLPALALMLRTPAKTVLDAAIDRLPEGPPEEARRSARFQVEAVASGREGARRHGVLRGSDVYGLTAAIAVHGALLMATDGYDRAGVLAPAQAYDAQPFLDHLAGYGLALDLGEPAPAAV